MHIGDCVKYLEQCIEEGRTFDYVINDLTAIPVTKEPIGMLRIGKSSFLVTLVE